MKFNIKNLNPGHWFYFDDNKPEEGRICLRVCPENKLKEIIKATSETVVKMHNGNPYETTKRNETEADKMLWDYVIVSWEGLTDVDGETEIPCTAENKHLLMAGDPFFSEFVSKRLEALKRMDFKRREGLEKNL